MSSYISFLHSQLSGGNINRPQNRTSAWFGDLKDGEHKGDANDPRVSLIEVIPEEIRYWWPTEGKAMRAIEIGISAVTGQVASPGELRVLTPKEVSTFSPS